MIYLANVLLSQYEVSIKRLNSPYEVEYLKLDYEIMRIIWIGARLDGGNTSEFKRDRSELIMESYIHTYINIYICKLFI